MSTLNDNYSASLNYSTEESRRIDIDWLRIIAIFLLIIYHAAIIFQPWAKEIGFLQGEKFLDDLWNTMSGINVWRMPLLFLISGMGLYFSKSQDMQKQLIGRAKYILLPLVFGFFVITPLHPLLFQNYYNQALSYIPNIGHLWYLRNIFIYFIVCIPIHIFIKNNPNNTFLNGLRTMVRKFPPSIILLALPIIVESLFISGETEYINYGFSVHGFILGGLKFLLGYLLIALGKEIQVGLQKCKYLFLIISVSLYQIRLLLFQLDSPHILVAIESVCWLFAILAFAQEFLQKSNKILIYLRQAMYPIYIIHLLITFIAASYILPLAADSYIQFLLIVACTIVGSFVFYEIVRRIPKVNILFGIK